jgi:hypothetical protein
MTTSHERDRILGWLDALDADQIAGASLVAVADSLRSLMEAAEAEYPRIDEDRLARDARVMRRARHGGVDAAVGEWLAARPSPARVDIASVVLQTLWNPALGTRTADPNLVEALLATRNTPGLTEEGEASVARALSTAFEAGLPQAVGDRVLDALADALQRPNANPALHGLIRRTLGNAGRGM